MVGDDCEWWVMIANGGWWLRMVGDDCEWWVMIANGGWWLRMVGDDCEWWVMIANGGWWLRMVGDDCEWWVMIANGGWWLRMVGDDCEWWVMIANGGWWLRMVGDDCEWWVMIANGGWWLRMVGDDCEWWVMIANGGWWFKLLEVFLSFYLPQSRCCGPLTIPDTCIHPGWSSWTGRPPSLGPHPPSASVSLVTYQTVIAIWGVGGWGPRPPPFLKKETWRRRHHQETWLRQCRLCGEDSYWREDACLNPHCNLCRHRAKATPYGECRRGETLEKSHETTSRTTGSTYQKVAFPPWN